MVKKVTFVGFRVEIAPIAPPGSAPVSTVRIKAPEPFHFTLSSF